MNLRNYGIVEGRIASVMPFDNKDGSATIKFKVGAMRDYKNKETNKIDSDFVEVEAFLTAEKRKNEKHPLNNLKIGTAVCVQYTVKTDVYTDESGKKHYPVKHLVQKIEYRETLAQVAEREKRKAESVEPEMADVELEVIDADMPF